MKCLVKVVVVVVVVFVGTCSQLSAQVTKPQAEAAQALFETANLNLLLASQKYAQSQGPQNAANLRYETGRIMVGVLLDQLDDFEVAFIGFYLKEATGTIKFANKQLKLAASAHKNSTGHMVVGLKAFEAGDWATAKVKYDAARADAVVATTSYDLATKFANIAGNYITFDLHGVISYYLAN